MSHFTSLPASFDQEVTPFEFIYYPEQPHGPFFVPDNYPDYPTDYTKLRLLVSRIVASTPDPLRIYNSDACNLILESANQQHLIISAEQDKTYRDALRNNNEDGGADLINGIELKAYKDARIKYALANTVTKAAEIHLTENYYDDTGSLNTDKLDMLYIHSNKHEKHPVLNTLDQLATDNPANDKFKQSSRILRIILCNTISLVDPNEEKKDSKDALKFDFDFDQYYNAY